MFFVAIGISQIDLTPFLRKQFETTTSKLGNFHFFLAYDTKLSSLFKSDDKLILTESIVKVEEEKIRDLLDCAPEKLSENLILHLLCADSKKKEIFIRRPFLSERTLYFYIVPDRTAMYLSTHLSLLKQAGVKLEEDLKAVAEYIIFGHVMSPSTLCKNVKKLSNGQNLKISCEKFKLNIETEFFPFKVENTAELNKNITSKRIAKYLRSTIARIKPYEGKIALSFSGGLDSAVLAKLLQQDFNGPKAYSMIYPFEDPEKSIERIYASTGAKTLQLDHAHLTVASDQYLESFIDMIADGEEPVWFFLQAPLFCFLMAHPPKEEEIVVFGNAADIIFGTDFHQSLYHMQDGTSLRNPRQLARTFVFKLAKYTLARKMMQFILRLMQKEGSILRLAKTNVAKKFDDPNHFLWQLSLIGDEKWTEQKFGVSFHEIICDLAERIRPYSKYPLYDIISICEFLAGRARITDSSLSKIGEKYGRKLLLPYCDDVLIKYVFQLPWKFKLIEPKHALREVAREIGIPEFIVTRPKSGFGTQPEFWALPGKIFEPFVALCSGVFSEEEFRAVQSEDSRKSATFWFMINYAIWKEIFINDISPDELKLKLHSLTAKATNMTAQDNFV